VITNIDIKTQRNLILIFARLFACLSFVLSAVVIKAFFVRVLDFQKLIMLEIIPSDAETTKSSIPKMK
jgi:hypothetical protein